MAKRRKTEYIVIHTTASRGKLTVSSLRHMHRERGFRDIGYGKWISREPRVMEGRGYDEIGAHVAGYNMVSVGIAWEGGYSGNDMTPGQEKLLLQEVKKLCKMYPNAKVCGHRDLSPDGDRDGIVEPHEWTKTCPWFDAEVWAKKHGLPHTNFSGKAGPVRDQRKKGPDDRDMWLQRLLRNQGYNLVVDGYVGPSTKKQIELFQQDNNLTVTKRFDADTVALLRQLSEEPRRPGVTKVAEKVAAVDRVSKKELSSALVFSGSAIETATQVNQQIDATKGILENFTGILTNPSIMIVAAIGVLAAFIFWRRWQDKKQARQELGL